MEKDKKEEVKLEEVKKEEQKQTGRSWLVPVDGSENAKSALNFVICRMDKKKDTLFLLTVVEQVQSAGYSYGAYVSYELIKQLQKEKELAGRALLVETCEYVKKQKIEKVRLILGVSGVVGDMICSAIDKHDIEFCAVGRRGLGKLKRLFVGSTSKYIVEHANCDVFVVKGDYGPEEIHDITPETVKKLEEIERIRRINEEKEHEQKRKFESAVNKNLTIHAEEKERMRRIQEEKDLIKKEEEQRKAEKIGVVIAEEQERKRRIEELKEKYKIESFLMPPQEETTDN